jgi:hypothetical protein
MATPSLEELGIEVGLPGLTLFAPNSEPHVSLLTFPQSGTVSLTYVPGAPAPQSVVILHQGGRATPVTFGLQNHTVNANDVLYIVGPAASARVQYRYV